MAPSTRPDYKINLDGLGSLNMNQQRSAHTSATNSPIEAPAGSGLRYPLGNGSAQAGPGRAGAGSPSKEFGSRLFPKRAREIQAQEGLSPSVWGPPTTGSGHSTPLRESIPESPNRDSFPDYNEGQATAGSTTTDPPNATRRARAGTVPSRIPSSSGLNGSSTSLYSKSNRATPSTSPYGANTPTSFDPQNLNGTTASNAALLSRLRAGSMPQRNSYLGASNPFGNSLFASNWLAGRERASTLQSIRSSDAPSSPRDSPADNHVRTLDYLGLVDTPTNQNRSDQMIGQANGVSIADLAALNAMNSKNMANRFRSYSVNAKEKYADGDDADMDQYEQAGMYSGQMTPSAEQAAAINEAVRQHNLEVQAFANFASANRPRARTAGVLDSPSSRVLRNYMPQPSRLDSSMTAADLQSNDGSDFNGLSSAVQNMHLNTQPSFVGLDANMESATRSLWLGNIPSSTTISTLESVFVQFGPVESVRVLTHKSCGFVNFKNVESAVIAKAQCNGKELLPGSGPVRIGYAKEQSASNTPGPNGAYPSPSPDPFVSKNRNDGSAAFGGADRGGNINAATRDAALVKPNLLELKDEVRSIVQQFGATPEDQMRIISNLENAMSFHDYQTEIPPIPESSHNRVHDAPRLREIRKRIDNNSCSPMEIESIAQDMLPEIAELSSDYLGNTVVQKLFENCSEDLKVAMLQQIAPHLAEIGVHKNGTWAAQKIIDVARSSTQMHLIVDALRPHAVNLFLDQYGNYVIQCCLRFQAPAHGFIFDTMINQLWEVAQGRFGARAVRACLESHFATNDQKRLMAAAIALHSVQLATNSNGALLLTWFLDTCTFPRRRSVLAPRLIPHLVHLCTHKVAYLTVLKIVNQRNEPDARDSILRALFFDDQTLNDIVSEPTCGATLIFKVLTTPFLDNSLRPECLENVRNVLLRIKAQPNQGYKRLMDEVGLSTRHNGTPPINDSRGNSKTRQGSNNNQLPHLDTNANTYGRSPYTGGTPQQQFDHHAMQRNVSMDSSTYPGEAYANNGLVTPQYTHSPAMSHTNISPMNPQQLQYQQALLAQAQAQMPRPAPGAYYGSPNGMAYAPQSQPPLDPYRNGSPMMPPGIGYQPHGFGQMGMGMGSYGGYPQMPPPGQMPGYFPQGQGMQQGMQQQQGGQGRRGRVS
ncbi:uncharacterized protein LTR77_001665 [Saxophila tyrrhenica]|uniref:Pumilio n=1 Tax=Saxophila tyrrhenica TaxID=1690608 RepID=A0AAV9PM54_9PEZI|nr:hypothetical protein LTR77_001665 [Saxophila tyrrhenica]